MHRSSWASRCRAWEEALTRAWDAQRGRAEAGTQRLRHSAGAEARRPGPLLLQRVGEPLLGCMRLALGTVAVATSMLDAVLPSTAGARIEAVAIVSASALLDGADDPAVCEEQMGGALQVLGRKHSEDFTESGHGRSPCLRALRRV
jgi:hypothetical protein